jgi:alcohol dehydrogenase (cytochrome c)
MTVAPLVADGVVITGISGGEFGIRGFIDGWDPKTGEHLWRTYTNALKMQPSR